MPSETLTITQEKTRTFAIGLSFYKLSIVFILGSLIGTWYEEIITWVKFGVYQSRAGVMYGPFNPIYGVGFLLAVVFLHRFNKWYVVVLLGSIFGGLFEYGASWAQEFFTGSVSWDYSHLLFNINGRTTVIYSIFWGLLVYFLVKVVYPIVSDKIEQIPFEFGRFVTIGFLIFLSINMFISYSALIRQGFRTKGYEPFTVLGELYDRYYTDERIKELFPNMNLLD